jgi:hypothetical protein
VARTKAFLIEILNPVDYVTDKVTFVPHKLVLPSTNQKASKAESDKTDSDGPTTPQQPSNRKLKTEKRRKSNESAGSEGSVTPPVIKKQSFRVALASINYPVCCGPSQVRFAHDPYSANGGCTYISLQEPDAIV